MHEGDVIEYEGLRSITHIDCSTPRCAANAAGTGRLVRGLPSSPAPSEWNIEIRCPDCGEMYQRRSPRVQTLAAALLEPVSVEREERIALLLGQISAGRRGA